MQARLLKIQASSKSPEWLMKIEEINAIRQKSNQEIEEQRRIDKVQSMLTTTPPIFAGKTWDDFVVSYEGQKKVKQIAENFVLSFSDRLKDGTCLKFLGESGRGKTFLSLIICQALFHKGYSFCYEPSLRFLKIGQEQAFLSFHAFQQFLNSYKTPSLLVIDEAAEGCGTGGYPAPWERNMLNEIINLRYVHQLPTLMISNHTTEELIERLGEPTMGRLSENGITLVFNWKSYR
jgi:DNA replication protein DnaC